MPTEENGKLFVIHGSDNVATAIDAVSPGYAGLVGTGTGLCLAREPIPRGFKLALREIAAGEEIIKYGVPIGRASRDISPGSCVHTHNMVSLNDERSGSFAAEDAAPQDMRYYLED